jgi:molybdopterin converting factor small subunit
MSIKVRFWANTRELVGKPEVDVLVEGLSQPTVRDVLRAVAEAEKRDLSSVLRADAAGSGGGVRVVRNGVLLPSLDVRVADGDTLLLFPLLGGG